MKKVNYTDSLHDLTDSHNKLANQVSQVGTRSQRPSNPAIGTMYFDTTIGLPIWWNGQAWIDAKGVLM